MYDFEMGLKGTYLCETLSFIMFFVLEVNFREMRM